MFNRWIKQMTSDCLMVQPRGIPHVSAPDPLPKLIGLRRLPPMAMKLDRHQVNTVRKVMGALKVLVEAWMACLACHSSLVASGLVKSSSASNQPPLLKPSAPLVFWWLKWAVCRGRGSGMDSNAIKWGPDDNQQQQTAKMRSTIVLPDAIVPRRALVRGSNVVSKIV